MGYTKTLSVIISELFNAISITIAQNSYNTYYEDTRSKNFEKVLGAFVQYSFVGIALLSFIGSYLYKYMKMDILIVPALFVISIIFTSYFMLPKQQINKVKNNKSSAAYRPIYKIILRKILSNSGLCMSFVLMSVYYQIVIQYWQIIANELSTIHSNSFWLGVVFFSVMLSQSYAGKRTKDVSNINRMSYVGVGLLISIVVLIASLYYKSLLALVLSMALFCFFIRTYLILSNVMLHKTIQGKIKSRFDSVINTIIRVSAAVSFIGAGLLSNIFTVVLCVKKNISYLKLFNLFLICKIIYRSSRCYYNR